MNDLLTDDPTSFLRFVQFDRIPLALLIAFLAWAAAVATTRVLDDVGTRFTGWRIALKQLSAIGRFIVLIIGTVLAVTTVVHLTSEVMFAIGGSVAVAVGFASKDLLASFMAGLMILFDRPFQVGDRVQVGDTYGEVVEIGLRTTRIATLDDNLVSIPNSRFLTDSVASANAGALDQMCVFSFYLCADQDFVAAKRIVYEAVATSRFVYLAKPVVVHVKEAPVPGMVAMAAIHLTAKAYVMDGRFEIAFATDVHERTKLAFRASNIRTVGDLTAQAA